MNQHLFLETRAMAGHAGKLRLFLLAGVALFNCMPIEMSRAAVEGRDPPIVDQHSLDMKLLGMRTSPIAKRQQMGVIAIITWLWSPSHDRLAMVA
jgi:hypothetical protein